MFSNIFKPNVKKLTEERNVKALIKLLQNRDHTIRGDAAKALGEISPDEAGEYLIAMLNDIHHYPAVCAFNALSWRHWFLV